MEIRTAVIALFSEWMGIWNRYHKQNCNGCVYCRCILLMKRQRFVSYKWILKSSSAWNPEAITFDTMRLGSQARQLWLQTKGLKGKRERERENQCNLISLFSSLFSRLYLFATGIAKYTKKKTKERKKERTWRHFSNNSWYTLCKLLLQRNLFVRIDVISYRMYLVIHSCVCDKTTCNEESA